MNKIFGNDVEKLKNEGGYITSSEIYNQPSVWKDTLKIIDSKKDELKDFLDTILIKKNLRIIFTGAGTSGFIGDTVVPSIKKKLDVDVESIHTTDIVSEPETYLKKSVPTLLISFARSGNSPESVATIELARNLVDELYQVVITCNKDGKLAQNINPEMDKSIILPEESNDKGFAMTSSYTSMVLSSLMIFDLDNIENIKKDINKLFSIGEDLLNNTDLIETISNAEFKKIIYLGSGSFYGLSRESSLKLLELTQGEIVTKYDTPLGFRHGPKSIMDDETLIVMFLSSNEYTLKYEMDLLKELYNPDSKYKVLAISETKEIEIENLSHYHIALTDSKSSLDKAYLSIDYVIIPQIISVLKSINIGINPDNPSPDGSVNRVVKGVTIYPYNK
ncbi:SIS domain-containing protein [Senegalia massiliensis]|uniref:SIS domain-containing protein n=1 Tax=Senegalia massiliensis TaxID=1720316 RepID=UPI001031631D|nr:SIS domain-containing protein [Senegalia massiliensis]